MYLLLRIASVVFMIGNYLVDGPLPPTLDFMLRIFGFRMVPAGIEQVWPLLLTYVAPPEEAEAVPVLSWIFEWLAIGNNQVLAGLILGLTYWTVMHFYRWTDSLGASVLKGDAEYKAKVLKHMKLTFSSRRHSGFGRFKEIRLEEQSFYALQMGPAIMKAIDDEWITCLWKVFAVNIETVEDDNHYFLLFSGTREAVEASYNTLRQIFR